MGIRKVHLKFPIFDSPLPFVRHCLFYMHPPQRTFALVSSSPILSNKIPQRLWIFEWKIGEWIERNKKKKHLIFWTRLKTSKLLATVKQLSRKNSVCSLKNQANVRIGLRTPFPPVRFRFLFKDSPLPTCTTNVLVECPLAKVVTALTHFSPLLHFI